MWNLFVDDERVPQDAGWHFECAIARSSTEAIRLVEEKGLPAQISFDHDLGGDDTAFKFMWHLIEGHLDERWSLREVQQIQIHTANPIGAEKMISLWTGFCGSEGLNIPVQRVWPRG